MRTTLPLHCPLFPIFNHEDSYTLFYKKVVGKKVVLDLPELKKVLVLA